MPLPNSPNQISLSQVGTEFEDTAPHSISEFYGLGTPPLPSSGQFSMSDFHGTSSYEENTWSVQYSGSVGHTLVQDANDFDISMSTSGWQAGDLLVVALKVNAVSSTVKSGYFDVPSNWTEGYITEDIYTRPNVAIFARIITTYNISGGSFYAGFPFDDTGISTVNHSFGYGWWLLRKTSGTPAHDSVERRAGRGAVSTSNTSSISLSIPPFTPFDNADSPILVGITSHLSSSNADSWSNLTNYSGMNSNTLGHKSSTSEEQNWAAAIRTWSNRAQPSNISGYATGHAVAWAMFVTPPT